MLTIKNGNMQISCTKDFFEGVNESSSGIIFHFKDKSRFSVEDPYLPHATKTAIKFALDGDMDNITIDVKNYNKPIIIENIN